jgi:hypothetical protein
LGHSRGFLCTDILSMMHGLVTLYLPSL